MVKFFLGFYISGFGGSKSGFSGFGVFAIGFLGMVEIGDIVLIFFLENLPKIILPLFFHLPAFSLIGRFFRLLKLSPCISM